MKKVLITLLVLAVAFSAFAGGTKEQAKKQAPSAEKKAEAPAPAPAKPAIKNPDTLVYATYGTIDTLDTAKAYDTASWTMLRTMYDTLVTYDGSATDKFVPVLATEVPTVANGGITNGGRTYRFKVRKGVKFHNGDTLTPEDIAYSIKRNMVLDVGGGPDWIWYYIFLGTYSSRDGKGNIVVDFKGIDKAVTTDGDYVVFNLKKPFPPLLGVVAGAWASASVYSKNYIVSNGGWDGTEATWKKYNNPKENTETMYDKECGTGPYKLDRWEKGVEMVVIRNDNYWGPEPALKKGIYKIVKEWSTRKLMLIQGDADIATVDPLYYPEMDKEKGLTVYRNLPTLNVGGINFNEKISTQDNQLIYSGKLDGEGIPGNFFADKDIRLAFIYSWDEQTFLKDIVNGHGMDPVTPIPFGLPYKDKSLKSRPFDKKKAEEHFKKAFGGKVWKNGFKVDLLYNSGNKVREASDKMLSENVMSLNPKFKINVRGVEWSEYVDMIRRRTMPIYFIGWAPDYPDPDNYVYPYMHSTGTYAGRAGYKNPEADKLIEEAGVELNPAKRKEMYYRLQQIWLDDAVGIINLQGVGNRYMKNWVKGAYYNPMQSSPFDLLPVLRKQY
ncbi:MAG: ABC transporter substrate-binding protein [Spirochaetes bacterium]|nr:ABC transporter substrate-binding protein [Spirochaetota bacterium]